MDEMSTTVDLDDRPLSAEELAEAEAASAKRALRLAGEALEEVQALADDAELAAGWRDIAFNLAGVALGHSHRATQYGSGSRAAREARAAAKQAVEIAEAADNAARKD